MRLVTISLIAGLFYLCARWAAKGEFSFAPYAGGAYTWAASSLVVLLMSREVRYYAIALGWVIFGVFLFEVGVYRKSRNFRAQSYVLFGLSFLRLPFSNLDNTPGLLLLTTLPIAFLFYYVYLRLSRLTASNEPHALSATPAPASPNLFAFDSQIRAATVLAYFGSATLVLFANSYYYGGSRLLAWGVLSLLFIAMTWFARRNLFHTHSILLAVLVFFRALGYEMQVGGGRFDFAGALSPAFYVSAVAAILFAAQAFAFPLRTRYGDASSQSSAASENNFDLSVIRRRSEQLYFFLPMLLVTFLILNEVSFGRVTISWGIEAVAVFLFALIVRERSFRLAALGLLLVCVAKIGLLDVWRQHGSDRYATLIILGVALLLVSYLYTRYAEAIRRYL